MTVCVYYTTISARNKSFNFSQSNKNNCFFVLCL